MRTTQKELCRRTAPSVLLLFSLSPDRKACEQESACRSAYAVRSTCLTGLREATRLGTVAFSLRGTHFASRAARCAIRCTACRSIVLPVRLCRLRRLHCRTGCIRTVCGGGSSARLRCELRSVVETGAVVAVTAAVIAVTAAVVATDSAASAGDAPAGAATGTTAGTTAGTATGTADVIGILVFLVERHQHDIPRGSGRNLVDELTSDLLPGPEANAVFHRAEERNLILDGKTARVLCVVDATRRVIDDAIANRLPNRSEGYLAVALRRNAVDGYARSRALLPADKGVARSGRCRQRNSRILDGIGVRKVRKALNRTVAGLSELEAYAVVVNRPSRSERQVARGSFRNARDRLAVYEPGTGITAAYRRI